jgi:RES domain-containing protein
VRWAGTAYRGHDPRWAFAPTSGAGAAVHGGRFNPKGVPALYLALSIEGVVAEQSAGMAFRFEPFTVVSYDVDMSGLIDLSTPQARAEANVDLETMAGPWMLDRAEGRRPSTWTLAQRLISEGASGMLYPSFAVRARPDMVNLVAWRWGPDLPHRIVAHDPSGKLLQP